MTKKGFSPVKVNIFYFSGDYSLKVQISGGGHSVFSVTLSDGFMDEYVDFDPPVVEDQPTDEEFFKHAKSGDLGWENYWYLHHSVISCINGYISGGIYKKICARLIDSAV